LRIIILLIVLTGFLQAANAQVGHKEPLTSEGKDFYVGLPFPSSTRDTTVLAPYAPKLFISSYSDSNSVTISYFDPKNGREIKGRTYLIKSKRTIEIPLDKDSIGLTGDGEIPEWKSAHITSKDPISIQCFSSGANSGGSYTALPVLALGREYVIESYNDNLGNGGKNKDTSSGYFLIVAAYQATTIQIIPNSTTRSLHRPGAMCGEGSTGLPMSFTISLERGQCYLVKSSAVSSSCDISSSTVISDKPISVLAGNENASVSGGWVDASGLIDTRDYMIEQLIPIEFWDTTGYVSIPLADAANPLVGGEGDEFRTYYGKLIAAPWQSPTLSSIIMNPGNVHIQSTPYQNPISSISASSPVNFYSTNGAEFHVVQYERRMQGSDANPSPSQMGLLPMSAWRTAYLWHVPNITEATKQSSYINLICQRSDYLFDSLQVSINGSLPKPIHQAGLQVLDIYDTIPDHPGLLGITMLIPPGDYYIVNTSTIKKPFVVYSYGRGIINSGTTQNSFSYASVAGFIVGPKQQDTTIFKMAVDTSCTGWRICCKLIGGSKITSINLLNDQDEDLVDKPNSSIGYVNYNTRFDPADDPDNTGEISLDGSDSSKCISIIIPFPHDSAYAPVLFVDDRGNYEVLELNYHPPMIADTAIGKNITIAQHSVNYPSITLGDSDVATIYFYNNGSPSASSPDINITDLYFEGSDNAFEVTKLMHSLPVILRPSGVVSSSRDTLGIQVRFKPSDTLQHTQKIVIAGLCVGDTIILNGKAQASSESVSTSSIATLKVYQMGRQLMVELPSSDKHHLDCFLFDLLGRKILEWNNQEPRVSLLSLPLQEIPTGIYLMKVDSYSVIVFINQ
jgi:hypothetical protein